MMMKKNQTLKTALGGVAMSFVVLSSTSSIFAQTPSVSYSNSVSTTINGVQHNDTIRYDNISTENPISFSNESYFTNSNSEGKHTLVFQIGSNTIFADGNPIETDSAPFLRDNTTMLSIRAVTDTLKTFQNYISVNWNSVDKSVKVVSGEDTIVFKVGDKNYTINDEQYTMTEAAPEIKEGRMYLPLRVLSQAMNLKIDWNSKTKEITLSNP